MNCPGCQSNAVEQGFEGAQGKNVLLDVCHTCHGLWFDARESFQLSSKGVLRLFREMHGKRGERHRLSAAPKCPRCREVLVRTHDMVRGNRFQYFRCPSSHGHFVTFFQFLREKGIARSLTPKELTELKKHAETLQCSDCGGAIALARDSACSRCHAPLSILDPQAVGVTLEDAKKAAAVAGAVLAPAVAAQLLMDNLKMDSFYRRVDAQAHQVASTVGTSPSPATEVNVVDVVDAVEIADVGVDLIDLGIDAVFDAIGGIGSLF